MTTGKRQPPFRLDMSFAEALERFGQTKPSEISIDDDGGGLAAGPVKKAKASRKASRNAPHKKVAGPTEA